jgi:hypothetical protein
MNNWNQIYKMAIVESDDTCDRWDRNGLNFLFYWKALFPKFKISLFTIPNKTSDAFIKLLFPYLGDWIELCIHGFDHNSNFENYDWTYEDTINKMKQVKSRVAFESIYKSAGWSITHRLNGYPASPEQPVYKDPQCVYKGLIDSGMIIVDRHYNKIIRPFDGKYICIDCNPNIVHFHSWNMETSDPNGRNGYQQIETEKGVPWDNNTEFYFLSEAWEKGLIEPCK